jgi:hypothetical protein
MKRLIEKIKRELERLRRLWDAWNTPLPEPPEDDATEPDDPQPPPHPPDGLPENVRWLHHDVSGWPVTSVLTAYVRGSSIHLDYDASRRWPVNPVEGGTVANPWILVNQGGQWYAATFEWLRAGQTSKPVKTVKGDHIKVSPLNTFSPRSGERYGFMVSGLARSHHRNVQERTNVSWLVWP